MEYRYTEPLTPLHEEPLTEEEEIAAIADQQYQASKEPAPPRWSRDDDDSGVGWSPLYIMGQDLPESSIIELGEVGSFPYAPPGYEVVSWGGVVRAEGDNFRSALDNLLSEAKGYSVNYVILVTLEDVPGRVFASGIAVEMKPSP